MALQSQAGELQWGGGRWLRNGPQWAIGVGEGYWPGQLGSGQGICLTVSSPSYTCLFSPTEVGL